MKRFLLAAVLQSATLLLPVQAGAQIRVGEPGFYGMLDVGDFPHPQLVHDNPVIVRPLSAGLLARPLYLYAPSRHVRNWDKYCHAYNACGRPVYFVTEEWYEKVYVPEYREEQRRRAMARGKDPSRRKGAEL